MSAGKMMVTSVDLDENWLYRVGGISALVIGVAYIIIVVLYALVDAPPIGGEAWLKYLAGKSALWWAIIGLSLVTNFLYVPVALALYAALKRINRSLMLIGIAFVGLFVILEPAVNWPSYASLVMLSERPLSPLRIIPPRCWPHRWHWCTPSALSRLGS